MHVAFSTKNPLQEGTHGVQHQVQRLWPWDQAPLCRLKVEPIAQRVLPAHAGESSHLSEPQRSSDEPACPADSRVFLHPATTPKMQETRAFSR
jgi:hypothetical protein